MNALDVTGLSKSYGPVQLLADIGFTVGDDERVGIVGRNGCGKTTLLRILAGLEPPDTGSTVRKRGLRTAYLAQRPQLDPAATIRQVIEPYLGEARGQLRRHLELSRAVAEADSPQLEPLLLEQQQVHTWLDHHRAWTLDHRIEEMCTRFGIEDPDARVETLSGGWAQRVALAGILLGQPDLLLLDEPTNQLDTTTVEWLEEHLLGYPGAVLLVTHDRYFLDRVVHHIFELEGGQITTYRGGYSRYLEQKAERLACQDRQQARLLNLLRREEAWLASGCKARTGKQKARVNRVEQLRDRAGGGGDAELSFTIAGQPALGGTVLEARGVRVQVAGRDLVRNFDFSLRQGERIGVLGPNGCGKTSLVRCLLGELEPAAGLVNRGRRTRVGYLDQERSGLDPNHSVAEALAEGDWVRIGGPAGEARHKAGYLEQFLFTREDQRQPVGTLSGGERARLLLARLLLEGANVLVLDEPTNDLDIPTLQVLDEALCDFAGCVLMVTHDRYFLDRVATGILHFEGDRRVVAYQGNYTVFARLLAQRRETERATEAVPGPRSGTVGKQRAEPRARAGLSYREKQELATLEGEIERLEQRQTEIETLLADPARLPGGQQELTALAAELGRGTQQLEAAVNRWADLEEKNT